MREVFGDAGSWIAVTDVDDALHQAAMSVSRSLMGTLVVTHELVLVELLDYLSGYGPIYRTKSLQVVKRILEGPGTLSLNFPATDLNKPCAATGAMPTRSGV